MEGTTDLKNVLQEDKTEKKEDVKINKHKKPMQLRDIESRSSTVVRVQSKVETPENMKKFIDEEKTQLFKQPWNRLDTGMKLNRIRLFSEQKSKEKKLSKEKQEELRIILADACRNGKLNKLTDVNYDTEECCIISVKNLEIKENKILLTFGEVKKAKKTTKSKSNVERLLSKKS
tara:strand:+ start:62 stop:586 length:525 start_codon:yes stop_codon:yes gene_type:complete